MYLSALRMYSFRSKMVCFPSPLSSLPLFLPLSLPLSPLCVVVVAVQTDCIHLRPEDLGALKDMCRLESLSLSGLTKVTDCIMGQVGDMRVSLRGRGRFYLFWWLPLSTFGCLIGFSCIFGPFVCLVLDSLIVRSFIHSFIHSWFNDSCIHPHTSIQFTSGSFICSFNGLFIYSFVRWLINPSIYSFVDLCIQIHLFCPSLIKFIHSMTHSLIRSCVHSRLTDPCIRSHSSIDFIDWLIYSFVKLFVHCFVIYVALSVPSFALLVIPSSTSAHLNRSSCVSLPEQKSQRLCTE